MYTSENEKVEEFHRSSETGNYNERVAAEEFLGYKVKRISELSSTAGTGEVKRSPKKKKKTNLFISALAAVGSAAIITVAVVTSLLGITVKLRNTGYDFISYEIAVAYNDGSSLFGRLSNGGEIIDIAELTSDEASVRFDGLQMNMQYLFEVVDEEGKIHFTETVKTFSPINFYTRGDSPGTLFFAVDIDAFGGNGIYYPMLRDNDGRMYELPIQTGWETETAISLSEYLAGEYTLAIVDGGNEVSYDIYSEAVYIDGSLPARLVYSENYDKITVVLNEKVIARYDEIKIGLRNNDGISTEITEPVLDLSIMGAGDYTLIISGIKNSAEEEIYRENIYVPSA